MCRSPNKYKRKDKQNKLYREKNKSLIYMPKFIIANKFIIKFFKLLILF